MIKKLKIKFILTNMVLITIVMVTAFIIIYFNTARDLEQSSINAMHDLAQDSRGKSNIFPKQEDDKEGRYPYLSTYIIEFNKRDNKWFIEGFSDSEQLTDSEIEYINNLIYEATSSNKQEGVLENHNMRYYYQNTPSGKKIVLLDKSYEDERLHQLLISFLIIGVIAFAAFLVISIIVASIAIKPVAESIKQQKQLVSDMSHELKTPITVISTNTDIILSHNDSIVDNERKWLGYIKDETKRMSELINMMLFLAKTDESNARPLLEDISLSDAAFEIALPFETICYENRKRFNINIEPNIMARGDVSSIKQLLLILLDNAVKYSNENGLIEIRVSKHGEKPFVSVYNTGEPIPKDCIPYIFDRFYRIDKARSRDKGGSGLGLSIAKRIIENNNANISVISNITNGTIFTCAFEAPKHKKK